MLASNYSFLDIEAFASKFYAGRQLLITPYGYPVRFAALAPAGVQTTTINIAANADFIMIGLRARASIAAAATVTVTSLVVPLCRLLLTDAGSGENFTNGTVDVANYAEQGFVKQLPYPRMLTGKTAISCQISNYGAADTYDNVEIYLDGVQVRAY